MSTTIDFATLTVGDVVAEREFGLTRDSLVRYAGASGDFNPIHYRDDIAASVGLPGVLAHGMLTMGFAVQPVVDWVGDPAAVVKIHRRTGWMKVPEIERVQVWDQLKPLGEARWRIQQLFNTATKGNT